MSLPTRRQVGRAFGSLLRTARSGAGLSQEDLAERANIDRTYPSLLERFWIGRIDQARSVIMLTSLVLLMNERDRPDMSDIVCALELTNEELQRLRDEID